MGQVDFKTFMSDESVCSKEHFELCKYREMGEPNGSTDMKSTIKLEPLNMSEVIQESMKGQDGEMTRVWMERK